MLQRYGTVLVYWFQFAVLLQHLEQSFSQDEIVIRAVAITRL